MSHRFSRLEKIITKEKLDILKQKKVLVLGVGGVGGYVVESLARSGIGTLILVDFDKIDETNINRQIIALDCTIGKLKVDVLKDRVKDINPECNVITISDFINKDNIETIFDNDIDYLVDACDTIETKKEIIKRCLNKKIKFISSMGTGNKLHGEMFEITDISKTSVCPLCKVMRKELKNRGIYHLKVLYSKEIPVDTSGRSTGEDAGSRRSIPGSISFVPPVAGLLIAGEVIRDICFGKEK